jgi:hypothetical protein
MIVEEKTLASHALLHESLSYWYEFVSQTRSNSPVIDISAAQGITVAASPLMVSMHFYRIKE